MEENGANIIDIGGMSTAPYLKTIVSEKVESERITKTIKIIQNLSTFQSLLILVEHPLQKMHLNWELM